jgi:hypothetical protein
MLLSVAVLLGLAMLEAGAAAWHFWLHHAPTLPTVLAQPTSAGSEQATASSSPTDGEVTLPTGFRDAPDPSNAPRRPLRLLVIGESSGRGEPYHPWLSAAQIVGWRLERVFPGREVKVDIWATGGATLEIMHNRLASLSYRPDALFVYVGHNEFQARYAWMRDVDYYLDADRPQSASVVSWAATLARVSPLLRLINETRERQQVDLMPPRSVTRELVDRPVCTIAERAAIVTDFERRLEAIATYCESIKCLAILIIPPSNDAGFDPSRSLLPPVTTRSERIAWARSVAQARALEATDPAAAVRINRELVRRQPQFAESHFRLAKLLERTGLSSEALDHFIAAREADAMPLRCPEPLRNAYRAVARRHPAAILIDGPSVLASAAVDGIVGDQHFHDAQHPNLRGYALLAAAVLDSLKDRVAFDWPASTPVPVVDPADCARHFQLDSARWEQVCRRVAGFFRATAYIRFDPRFRNERAAAYERAANAISAGTSPPDAEIPGWPLPPEPSTSHFIPSP